MSYRRKSIVAAPVALLLVLLAGCGGGSTKGSSSAGGTIKIGTVLALSGSQASIAATYLDGIKAAIAAANDAGGVNGHKIDDIVRDDGFEVPRTISAAKQLAIQDHVVAFLGGFGTTGTLALKPIVDQLKVPLEGSLAYSNKLYAPVSANMFSLWPGYETLFASQVGWAISNLKVKKIGLIYRSEAAGDEAVAGTNAAASSGGATVVSTASYELGTTAYVAPVQRVLAGKPDAVVIYGSAADVGSILKTLHQLSWKGPSIDTVSAGSQQIVSLAGAAAADKAYGQVLIPLDGSAPGWSDYSAAIKKYTSGDPSNSFTASGYVAAQVLLQAVKSISGTVTASAVRQALESAGPFSTLAGQIQFSQSSHLGLSSVTVSQVQNGKVTPVGAPISLTS